MYSYHNTSNLSGPILDQYETKAKSQEQVILDWFRIYEQPASPSQCQALFHPPPPLTSIRRAFTNLTTRGELVKTDKQVRGPFGRPETQWSLPSNIQRRLF